MSLSFEKFTTLTFDCYGTLIDWESGILNAMRPVLKAHGVERTDRQILETYAELESKQESGGYVRYEVLLRLVMSEFSLRFGFDASLQELDCISRSIKDWPPFPDTVQALKKLKERYRLVVLSNIDDKLFRGSRQQLQDPFDAIITAQQVKAYKPAREFFEFAIDKLRTPPSEVLHVAQSLYHDIVPARAMGLHTVWVNRRAGRSGSGATPPAQASPDLEVLDLASLVQAIGL